MTDREPREPREGRSSRSGDGSGRRDGGSRRDGASSRGAEGRREGGARRDDRPARGAARGDRPERPRGERPERSDRPRVERPERGAGPRGPRSDRPRRDGDSRFGDRPRQERPGRGGEGRERPERPAWETRVERVRGEDRPKSPMIPEEITEKDLDLLVRVQFKTLSPENAERVARHLAMVNLLINDDPELAHRHALAAADRAGRIGVVRETLGITAYTIGDFALALRELQAYRRITGKDDELPIMVDCERGLGRPDKALELARSVPREKLEPGVRANLAIAISGARLDRNENDLALSELEIPELNPAKVFDYSPQLFRAYAHTLEILGRESDAERWFGLADRADLALADKNAPKEETISVIEEIVIPEPYQPRERVEREDRPRREPSDRPPRDSGDRPRREAGERPRRDSADRPRRDSSDRPRRDGDARPRRDSSDRPSRDDRGSSDRKPRGTGERPAWKKPKSE